jgi:glycosyltransferase involved in cell wall biosynthesis
MHEHAIRWQKEGHDIDVVTCQPNCPIGKVFDGYRNRFLKETRQEDNLSVTRVWSVIAPSKSRIRRILSFLSYMVTATLVGLFGKRPDIIIATSPQFFCGWAGIIVGKIRRVPVVLEIRDIWPESIVAVGAFRGGPLMKCLVWLEKQLYRLATHIVAVGDGYRDHIVARLGGHADKVSVITNGVDIAKFQPLAVDHGFREQHDLGNRFVCCYVGTIGMAHGLEVVVNAAKVFKERQNNDFVFLLVGDGARRQHLESLAVEVDVTDMVKFVGMLPKEQIPTVIASSDALLVHLRRLDLFKTVIPSKLFEIMAMQRPIILGVDGHARAIVEQAQSGVFVRPESADELVDALVALKGDPVRTNKLARSGRQFVADEYNRDTLASRYLRLLVSLTPTGEEKSPVDCFTTRDLEQEAAAGAEKVYPK